MNDSDVMVVTSLYVPYPKPVSIWGCAIVGLLWIDGNQLMLLPSFIELFMLLSDQE